MTAHHAAAGPLSMPAALAAEHGWRTVLAFGAHPDDLDFGAAATLAGFAAAGLRVELCVVTDGDAGGFDSDGPEAMTARRHAEQRAAAATVGAAEVHFLGERDGHLEPGHDVRRRIVGLMRRVRPDVVLSPHPERDWESMQAAHPDHLACGEAVVRAAYPAVENPYAYPELAAAGLPAFRIRHLMLYAAPAARRNLAVDVSGLEDLKIRALDAHVSQHPDAQGMRSAVRAMMRERHRTAAGSGAPEGSAEAFHLVTVNGEGTIAGF
ncbi:LmbE family N-acetylglucosaminyl deacetylase [Micrococcus flavus]|uniref:LmbE family N-acetylglucosaminyl deacetylase n=2 Tax=Micrococcus flavus TaxID=384602 RepID=A0A7W7L3L2_9MICC|nr:LmbE family N-acetylglucosaminyl deacetylase [Micrococcus flavus]GGK49129.1 GlcNAc-PI de-N-acetylase [Micrococcus flavus]